MLPVQHILYILLPAMISAVLSAALVHRRMRVILTARNREHENAIHALNAMHQQRQKQLAAIEAAGDGIAIVDPEGRLTYMNRALIALHALTMEQVADHIGRDWRRLYPSTGREHIEAVVMPALRRDRTWSDELEIRRADGQKIWAEMSLRLLDDGGLVGTARDVTARRQALAEREALQRHYDQAQKMEAIGRMTGGIAHDFNNMLTVISGHVDMLHGDAPDFMQSGFAAILRAIDRGSELTQRMLAFSRRQVLKPEWIDLNRLVPETMTLVRSTIGEQIELQLDLASGLAPVAVDAGQLENALLNLCFNARDAMASEKSGSIIVQTGNIMVDDAYRCRHPQANPGQHVMVAVIDTGAGIPPDLIERVIDPFFTTKEVGKGSGLGLSMVYGFVSQSGGHMVIESRVGNGTSIALYFPAADEPPPG